MADHEALGTGAGPGPVDPDVERRWRDLLTGDHPAYRYGRRIMRRLPSDTRCKLCAAPFHGPAAPIMRLVGKAPWPKNPKYCGSCFTALTRYHGGAEIECSLLFADVRGSTTLAEGMSATGFHQLMERFFGTAASVLVDHDAIVDKFVGDEVIGIFIPAMASDHARQAVEAARALMAGLQRDASGPATPVGVGVNSGVAYVGAVGSGDHSDLTAMGDPVNVAARLASAAGPGEILVAEATVRRLGMDLTTLTTRQLRLKGKSEPTTVAVLTAVGSSPTLD
ncbi:adenylate/guanylate cyclase domain-containing protein [soil metagenome]